MAVPAAPGRTTLTRGRDTQPPARPSRPRVVLAGVLAVLVVASLAVLVWLVSQRAGQDLADPSGSTPTQQEREQVMSQAQQFMLRMGTYGPELLADDGRMPEYRERVTAVITDKFEASFTESAGTAEQLVAQIGVSRQADVLSAGVSTIDDDSATALVAGTFTDSYEVKGERQAQEPVPFRLELALEKIDGRWLVDDFTPVVGAEQGAPGESGGLGPEPSPAPGSGGDG